MVRKLGAAAQVHTADQKVQKDTGCIAEPALACPDLSVPPVPTANSPFLAYGVERPKVHGGCTDGSCRTRDVAQFQEDRENVQCSKSIVSGTNTQHVTCLS